MDELQLRATNSQQMTTITIPEDWAGKDPTIIFHRMVSNSDIIKSLPKPYATGYYKKK